MHCDYCLLGVATFISVCNICLTSFPWSDVRSRSVEHIQWLVWSWDFIVMKWLKTQSSPCQHFLKTRSTCPWSIHKVIRQWSTHPLHRPGLQANRKSGVSFTNSSQLWSQCWHSLLSLVLQMTVSVWSSVPDAACLIYRPPRVSERALMVISMLAVGMFTLFRHVTLNQVN